MKLFQRAAVIRGYDSIEQLGLLSRVSLDC